MALTGRKDIYRQGETSLVTGPAIEPCTLAQVKDQLRLTTTDSDTFITNLIPVARAAMEAATGLVCITQEWQMTMDSWPVMDNDWWDGVREGPITAAASRHTTIEFPRYPLQAVDAVKTYDTADNEMSAVVGTVFQVDTVSRKGRMSLKSGQTWPVATRELNAVVIEYTAGFGDALDDVPLIVQRACAQITSYLFSHRGDACSPEAAVRESGALALLSEYADVRL
jgi:uncharacterized phiE125 gp8 family phage protein